jgi:HEAT repeats/PXPV repeat (3 copies)
MIPGRKTLMGVLASMAFLALARPAEARVFVGVGFNFPFYYPSWGPCYPYYAYRPVYVAPAPVYVAPAPVYVQPATAVQPTYSAPPPPTAPAPQTIHPASFTNSQPDVDRHLQQLGNADERIRSQSVIELGRMRAYRAADPLAATLAGDPSPAVREAAARALALIGSRQALPALQRAALADADHDVRHSAQFAIEMIQAGR